MAYARLALGMERVDGTPLQKQIEYIVTNGRGYEPRTYKSFRCKDTEDGKLIKTLYQMDSSDGKLKFDEDDEVPGSV